MARSNFMERTFAGGSKAVKFVKVFSLESFPLYGMHTISGNVVQGCLSENNLTRKLLHEYVGLEIFVIYSIPLSSQVHFSMHLDQIKLV